MITFKIKVKDVEKITPKILNKYKKILQKSMFKMEELAIRNAPVDTGFLKQRISLFPQILSDNYVLSAHAPYSEAMEYGTRPFYAPIAPLKEWARRKLGDENAAWAIRAKIAKVGITAQPFMRPALFQVAQFWAPVFAKQIFAEE